MPSVDIENDRSGSKPSTFARLGRKLCCCCSSSVQPGGSSVELTKANTVTEQPTSSRISVIKKNAFDDEEVDREFHSVSLEVPESKVQKALHNNIKHPYSANDRRPSEGDELEPAESPVEEVPPDTELLDVVEEATDSEIAKSAVQNRSELQNGKANGNPVGTEPKVIAPGNSVTKEAGEDTDKPEESKMLGTDVQIPLALQTTAPVEDGDFKVFSIFRAAELDELSVSDTPWSPQKPPRRASQLLASSLTNEEAAETKEDAEALVIEPETESTESIDDGIVPDIILTRQPDMDHQVLVTGPLDPLDMETRADSGFNNMSPRMDGDDKEPSSEDVVGAEQEETRSIGVMAVDSNPGSDYDDSLSTTITEQSFPDDEADPHGFVTRLSVRSNGEVLVSSPTFNGPIVKVKLGSEGITSYDGDDLNERIV